MVLLVPVLASAQLRGLGHVQGSVLDASGAPMSDVTISATLPGTGGALTATSNQKGEWKIVGIGRGTWDISFQKPGFASARAKVVLDVELARLPNVTVTMTPRP